MDNLSNPISKKCEFFRHDRDRDSVGTKKNMSDQEKHKFHSDNQVIRFLLKLTTFMAIDKQDNNKTYGI